MKKMIGLYVALLALLIPTIVNADSMPTEVSGKITLSENITLDEKFVVESGKTLTIDLAGYTLTGPNDNYAIDNSGNLTIIDSNSTKGKIVCPSTSSSCVRNNKGVLLIDGIAIESNFVAVKTEPDSNTTIKNSSLSSTLTVTTTGTILNWGNTNIDNSKILATSSGVAIYSNCGEDESDGVEKSSTLNISNSELEGKYTLYLRRSISSPTYSYSNVKDSKITGKISAANSEETVKMMGKIEVDGNGFSMALSKAVSGTEIVATTDVSLNKTELKDGVTLTIPEGKKAMLTSNYFRNNGILNVLGTIERLNIYNEEEKEYYPTLSNAYSNSDTNATLKLINNISGNTNIKSTRTIDLNGYSLNGDLTVGNDTTTINITDNSSEKTGQVLGTITNNGKLNILGGIFAIAPVTADGATTNLEGGTYPISNIENVTIPSDREIVENGDGTYSIVYKDADYSAVNEAITKAKAINRNKYTTNSLKAVDDALNAVVLGKKINEQQEVNLMADAINEALANLQEKGNDIKNPNTGDNIILYVSLGLISLCSIGYIVKSRKLIVK